MDNQTHYLTYDPEAIWEEMMIAYLDAGGDILYPGDEKELVFRGALAAFVQMLAGVDHALRMATLTYAVGDYLDIKGDDRSYGSCPRIEAQAARAQAAITTDRELTLPEGTAMTADGSMLYALEGEAVFSQGGSLTCPIVCMTAGSGGNSLAQGTQMQLMNPVSGVTGIVCAQTAQGGSDREEDEAYRERIRTHGLISVTTGPARQYEAAAMAVSAQILDARALNLGAGQVGVYLLAAEGADESALTAAVTQALSPDDKRPLNDLVTVSIAPETTYTLKVTYHYPAGSGVDGQAIAQEYRAWQDGALGRAFNPDRLKAALYTHGCTRVSWGEGSVFGEDGAIDYTEVDQNMGLKGTITMEGTEDA